MTARITIPIGDVAGVVRGALRAAMNARGLTLADAFGDHLDDAAADHYLHELGKVAARAVALLDVDKLAPGERGVVVMDVAG